MKQVTAAIFLRDDQVFIARRAADQKLPGFWEFPGGKIENGESPENCLARELEEEFGIQVKVGQFFCESIYHYGHGSIKLLCYWTEHTAGDFIPTVHDDIRWVPATALTEYKLAPADIPVAEKIQLYLAQGVGT